MPSTSFCYGVAGKLDIGDGSEIEVLEKFGYVGDMKSSNWTAELAIKNRIGFGWSKFGQLTP